MQRSLTILVVLLIGLALFVVRNDTLFRTTPAAGSGGGDPGAVYDITSGDGDELPDDVQARGFTFASGTAPAHQRIVEQAIAAMRPEARRLVEIVDGLVTVHVGDTSRTSAVGLTRTNPDGTWDVILDLDGAARTYGGGMRGIQRVVQHELGHVVDFAVVPAGIDRQLVDAIPHGWGCENGRTGACAKPAERFAETFAKWASGDIGMNLYVGYAVPPPTLPLDQWGAPLVSLGT